MMYFFAARKTVFNSKGKEEETEKNRQLKKKKENLKKNKLKNKAIKTNKQTNKKTIKNQKKSVWLRIERSEANGNNKLQK